MENSTTNELEALKEKALQEFSGISDTKKLVEAFINIVNANLKITGSYNGNGKIFRIGVTMLNRDGIVAAIRVIRKSALSSTMFLDTFYHMPLANTTLNPLLESMRGDYINDMEGHMNDELAKGRLSISSQICLRENVQSNMRFPYRTRNNSGFIFFSGDKKGMFNDLILGFVQDLIHAFEASLEVCNDLDALVLARENSLEKTGLITESYKLMHNIQKKLEPGDSEIPESCGMDIFHKCFPWEGHPSGDLLNIWCVNNKTMLLIADVTGHGMETAKITIFLRGLFLKETQVSDDPATVMENVHDHLKDFIKNNFPLPDAMFATAFFGVYDRSNGNFEFCNAGHIPPYLFKAGEDRKDFIELKTENMPLAMNFDTGFNTESVRLHPKDTLALYTDGLTEAPNGSGEQFGKNRLMDCVVEFAGKPIYEAGRKVLEEFQKHTSKTKWEDDVSILLARIV